LGWTTSSLRLSANAVMVTHEIRFPAATVEVSSNPHFTIV
jgi:hypothetical protein